jgi:hypothetical protein
VLLKEGVVQAADAFRVISFVCFLILLLLLVISSFLFANEEDVFTFEEVIAGIDCTLAG